MAIQYYHVSSFAQNGDIYYLDKKPLQTYIDYIESFDVCDYTLFLKAYNEIPDAIEERTGIRKTKWVCELLFESVRKETFISAPRRLHSIYLCRTLEEAIEFNRNYRRGKSSIFEVNIDGAVQKYDMQAFTDAEEYLFEHRMDISEVVYEHIKAYAKIYWSKLTLRRIEYLYEGIAQLRGPI